MNKLANFVSKTIDISYLYSYQGAWVHEAF